MPASAISALPAWPVAISTKESLVEVSPSTVTQLKDSSATSFTSRSSSGWAIAASVATKPSMVAMLGLIMPAPLLMPVTVIAVAANADFSRRALGDGVGGHDGVGGLEPAVGLECGLAGRQAGGDALGGQRLHDDAGGEGQHLRRVAAEQLRDGGAARVGRGQPRLAGAGVGDAGVDDQRADVARRQMLACTPAPARRRSGSA